MELIILNCGGQLQRETLENFLSLQKQNFLAQMHASKAHCVYDPNHNMLFEI